MLKRRRKLYKAGVLGGGGGGLPPFTDDFTRSDGALGNGWLGATWSIATNNAVNTPATFGTEKIADPGLEANYTAGACDSWAAVTGSPTLAQSADVHGGSKAQEFTSTAYGDLLRMLGSPVPVLGKWYQASEWAKRTAGAAITQRMELRSTGWSHAGVPIVESTYTQIKTQALCTTALSLSLYGVIETFSASGTTVILDDLSLVEMDESELYAVQAWGSSNTFTASSVMTVANGGFGGLIVDLDDPNNPQNYILAAIHRGRFLQAIKFVAGEPTVLFSTFVTPYPDNKEVKIVKSGTTYQFYFDGVQINTDQTISDVPNGNYHGIFSTHDENTIHSFAITT